jgi:hypothetical protein
VVLKLQKFSPNRPIPGTSRPPVGNDNSCPTTIPLPGGELGPLQEIDAPCGTGLGPFD